MKVGIHTGGTAYAGNIEARISLLSIIFDWSVAATEIANAKLTIVKTSQKGSKTIIPEIPFTVLMDLAGWSGVARKTATVYKFDIPLSYGSALDLEGGNLSYSITGVVAGATITLNAIEDRVAEKDYISIVPIGFVANTEKAISVPASKLINIDHTKVTRMTIVYLDGSAIELTGDEMESVCYAGNEIALIETDMPVLGGYINKAIVNISEAVLLKITTNADTTGYLINHELS